MTTLTGDAAYLASLLGTISGPIVLVGHSYGGAVTSNAAAGNEQVQALVFCEVMAATQRPWSGAGYATPSGPPGWRSIPSWYLVGTEDRAIPPAGQRFMAERANATIEEVPASHASMVSQPEAVTRLILRAVEATAAAGP